MSDELVCESCQINAEERIEWGDGPWREEPDRAEWEHAGLPCLAHRGPGGHWCGYAAVPPGHPLHGKQYDEGGAENIDAHGGLTYAKQCNGHICHVPKPGEPDNVWWFGMDFAHTGDLSPRYSSEHKNDPEYIRLFGEDHYWTLPEVRAETNRLAEQLAAVAAAA